MSNCHLNFLDALFVTQELRGHDGSDAVNRRVNAPGLNPPFSRRCYPFVTGTRRKGRRFNLAGTFYGHQWKNSAPDSHASSVSGQRNRNQRARLVKCARSSPFAESSDARGIACGCGVQSKSLVSEEQVYFRQGLLDTGRNGFFPSGPFNKKRTMAGAMAA
jgi:hypothetical protein